MYKCIETFHSFRLGLVAPLNQAQFSCAKQDGGYPEVLVHGPLDAINIQLRLERAFRLYNYKHFQASCLNSVRLELQKNCNIFTL